MVARFPVKEFVVGSNPTRGAKLYVQHIKLIKK